MKAGTKHLHISRMDTGPPEPFRRMIEPSPTPGSGPSLWKESGLGSLPCLKQGSRYEMDGFLKAHGVFLDLTLDDMRKDSDTALACRSA